MVEVILEELPSNLKNIGEIMSNFDWTIEPNAEDRLKNENVFGEYPAWHFHGCVWYTDGLFRCRIEQCDFHVATINGASLQEIMDSACKQFGSD